MAPIPANLHASKVCAFMVLTLLPSTTVPVLGNQGRGFPLVYAKMLLSHLKACDGKKSHPQQGANCLKRLWLEAPLQETVPLQLQVSLPCGFLKILGRSKVAGAVMRKVRLTTLRPRQPEDQQSIY